MWKQGGSRSSALDRAMAQLAAKKVGSAGDSQINENGSSQTNINLKSMLPGRQMEFQDLSDISSEDLNSEDHEDNVAPPNKALVDNELLERSGVGGGSRFLKKPSNAIAIRQSSAPSSQRLSMEEPIRIPQRRSQSAALSRLAQLEERFRHRKEGSYAQTTSPGQPTPQEDPLSAHSSTDLSMKGARFLKKKLTSTVPEQSKQSHVPHIAAKAPPSSVPSKGVSLDSDEEDMERLLGEYLNSSTESPGPKSYRKSTHKKTPTTVQISDTVRRRTPLPPSSEQASPVQSLRSVSIVYSPSPSPPNIQTSSRSPKVRFLRPSQSRSSVSANNEIRSLEELFTDTDDTSSKISAASDAVKFNVMTLDDLIPAEPLGLSASSKEKIQIGVAQDTSTRDDTVEDTSECTLDDIFPEDPPEEDAVDYESDFETDIKSEATNQSVSEIPEHLTDDDKVSEPAEDRSEDHIHYSLSQRDTNSEKSLADGTEMDGRKSFESYDGKSKDSFSRSYSSYSRSDTLTPTSVPHRRHVKEAAVQTEKGPAFTWPSGMDVLASTYMDPTPVARYTVSAEVLEALTSQMPVEAALNDMLKQQLAMTRHFIESSRHLYSSLLQSLEPPDYKYTTLEDTKEFIRKHRSPKLTMEKALEEVQQEMREYHYL